MLANLIYLFALTLASPLVVYRMVRFGRYRRGASEKLFGLSVQRANELRGDASECIWLHAVSVGEVNLLPGVIQQLRSRNPEVAIAISTSTDTGYDVAVKHFGQQRVFFCPLDFSWAVNRSIRNLSPSQLILAELELWPNLIRSCSVFGIPVMVINARLSEKSSAGYQKFGLLTRPTFRRLTWVGCQDDICSKRFIACGTPKENVCVTGSLKFDDAPTSRETPEVLARQQWAGIDPWQRVWMFGSTQSGEEALALSVYQTLKKDHTELRLILVPRHPERFDAVAKLVESAGLKVHRRSGDESLADQQWHQDVVILVDTVGELRHWWGVSHIATVGGSFGDRGGQNMLEPAGYGSAVSFGPNTRNFAEIADRLIDSGGAIRVASEAELASFVGRCLGDAPAADSLGRSAKQMIDLHRGATDRTVSAIVGDERRKRSAA
jgi:3-deoxy-D-manno-octulosonic-acid transferase